MLQKQADVTGTKVGEILVLEVEVDGLLRAIEREEVIPKFGCSVLTIVLALGMTKGFFAKGDAFVIGHEEVAGILDEFC